MTDKGSINQRAVLKNRAALVDELYALPLSSRIIAVVDAYSAMTSKRSYKDSMNDAEARAELVRCKGTHFDPRVVDAFLAVLDEAEVGPDDCPDGCGLLPELSGSGDFHHVLRAGPPGRAARA